MATVPALPPVSVEEYLNTDYEPHCEYLEGVLRPKPMPDRTHSRLQLLLGAYLLAEEAKHGFETVTEAHVRINALRWRVPDVSVLAAGSRDRYPDAEAPPLFTIEIASLEEPWPALRGKVTDHLSLGVSAVIIADPYNKTVMVARLGEPLHEVSSPAIVNIRLEAGVLAIDFDDLYRQL